MNNIKSYSDFLNESIGDWFDKQNALRDAELKKLNPQAGMWVNFLSEYGDVWHELKDIFYSDDMPTAIIVYRQVDSKSDKVKTEYTHLYNVRKIAEILPEDARCIYCSKGAFSERRGNLAQYYSMNGV